MLTTILIALGAIVAVLVVVIAMQPPRFRVTRTAMMSAPPAAVFAEVNDLRKWQQWSPWAKLDPAMTQTYEGAAVGTGASSTWTGNHQVGQGRMTITDSRPSDLIRIKLEFFKPFSATHTAEFTFRPHGTETAVTWSMTGEKNFMAKVVHLFMNMDTMVGGQFEQGLTQMKSKVEAQRRP